MPGGTGSMEKGGRGEGREFRPLVAAFPTVLGGGQGDKFMTTIQ